MFAVAGAGTGETTVSTRRIAHLITEGKARPHEILALTFTDEAAAEMEGRIDELGPYEVSAGRCRPTPARAKLDHRTWGSGAAASPK